MHANNDLMSFLYTYRRIRYNIFKGLYESNFIYKLLLVLCMACLTGLGAQLKIFLPFTPVPVTGQVFFVLLSGTLLGRYGGVSQAIYLGIGCLGVPWFAAGMKGGTEVLIGITGGFLIGFIIASTIIGMFTEKYLTARTFKFQLLLMLIGIGIIYAVGAIQFSLIMHTDFQETMLLAVIPFIPLGIFKAITASIISTAILPKKSYNGEREMH
jgi:biotin transport system substrate-specific component